MVVTTLLRSSALALTVVIAGGCVSMQPPDDFCGFQCSLDQYNSSRSNSGRTYNEHHSQEYREAMAHSRRTAERWADPASAHRITTAGPDVGAYGRPGTEGYMAVAECKRDVMRAVTDWNSRDLFLRMCYDLLPEEHREKFYNNDQRVSTQDPLIIVVPVR